MPPKERYEVRADGNSFVIFDNRLGEVCTLDGRRVLRWSARSGAQGWLKRCYAVWDFRPMMWDEPTPPETWGRPGRRRGEDRSPWEGWAVPNSDSMFGR